MNTDKTVLVTGGLGYIGSHTVVELLEKDFTVVVIDNLSNSKIEILEQIEKIVGKKPVFYELDLLDLDKLREVFQKETIDSVIHFAAHLLVDESVSNPLKYYRNNLVSLINLLEVMSAYQVEKLIFSSSCTVYGNPKKFPVTEETLISRASSPYGSTKIMGEQIIEDAVLASNALNAVLLRYFNPAGAHSSGLLGELSMGKPKHLFPILSHAFKASSSFKIFGKDYDTHDGTPVRDYIHVVDLAKAHVLALEKDLSQSLISLNIGTGTGLSVLEIIQQFETEFGSKLQVVFEQRRKGDVEKIWADSTKAKNILGWEPVYSLSEMVKSCRKWENYLGNQGWE